MPLTIPPELKPVVAYIRRAEELDMDTTDPDALVVAFYCRSYAMEKAMSLRAVNKGPQVDEFLTNLMQILEETKKRITCPIDQAKIVVETYVLTIFTNADEEDRTSGSNKETAKQFYNAATFFDVLEYFGELDEDLKQKSRYAKWKAADIMKSLKEGRPPKVGGFDEDTSTASSSSGPTSSMPFPTPGGGYTDISSNSAQPAFVLPSPPALPPVLPPSLPVAPGYGYGNGNGPPPAYYGNGNQPQMPPYAGYGAPPPSMYGGNTNVPGPTSHGINPPPLASPPGPAMSGMGMSAPKKILSPADAATKDAIEYAAFAIAAMKHNEINLAKDRLREALKKLGG